MEATATNVLMWLAGQVIAGAAIWGGIRVDIRNIHTRMKDIKETADEAHKRIDRLLESEARR